MSGKYALNVKNIRDISAISSLFVQSESVETESFETLAQYRVTDVQFDSEFSSLLYPRKWMLSLKTVLEGFNDQDGNYVQFSEIDAQTFGDGLVQYPIPADIYSEMVTGGLYDYPEAYVNYLIEALESKKFYRRTRMSVATITREDKDLDVDVGIAGEKILPESTFIVANDLTSLFDFRLQPLDVVRESNLASVLLNSVESIKSESMLNVLASETQRLNEETRLTLPTIDLESSLESSKQAQRTETRTANAETQVEPEVEVEPTPEAENVGVSTEISFDEPTEQVDPSNSGATVEAENVGVSTEIDFDSDEAETVPDITSDVVVEEPTVVAVNEELSMEDILSKLGAQTKQVKRHNKQKKQQRVRTYQDSFAQAKKEMEQKEQQQTQEHINQHNKPKSKQQDDGLGR